MLTVKRGTHTSRAGNSQNIFDKVMPPFRLRIFLKQLQPSVGSACGALVSFVFAERRRWRPLYQTSKTVPCIQNRTYDRGNVSVMLLYKENLWSRFNKHDRK